MGFRYELRLQRTNIAWGRSPTAEARRLNRLQCGFESHRPYAVFGRLIL